MSNYGARGPIGPIIPHEFKGDQNMRNKILIICLFMVVPFTDSARPQSADAVFRSQAIELHGKAVAVLERVEKTMPTGASQEQTRSEIFALVRLVHRLDEEAGATQPKTKTLMFVQQACVDIDSMLSALDFYVESSDSSFLGFARDSNSLILSIKKVM
jgi:hypothetical protein